MPYDFHEHKHRYAVWTAARAVQRSFTSTFNISRALEATSLPQFCVSAGSLNQEEFDQQQEQWCNQLIQALSNLGIPTSYGRAAKIVAIYLKTAIILPGRGEEPLASIIHPPIDNILLRSLSKVKGLHHLRTVRWSRIDAPAYWNLVKDIRQQLSRFDWTLEAHWQPSQAEGIKEMQSE